MPEIKVIYWNIEDFGDPKAGRRGNYLPLCNLITRVMVQTQADVLCIMELKATGVGPAMVQLQTSLLNAFNAGGLQHCDWCCDWVPGSLVYNAFIAPYDPNRVGFTAQGRTEGYAVFWKQNIAKFIMQLADPIHNGDATPVGVAGIAAPAAPAFVANTHSGGTRIRVGAAAGGLGVLPAHYTIPAAALALPLPAGVPVAGFYSLPAGSTIGAGGILNAAAGAAIVAAGPTAAASNLTYGNVLPAGTIIGPGGLTVRHAIAGVDPIVIPAGYTLPAAFTLPPAGTMIIPQRVLSLVLTGRVINAAGAATNYNPGPGGAANVWRLLPFPGAAGANLWNGSRRPAFCTLKAETGGGAANQLIPITFYHTPVAAPGPAMTWCAMSRQMYEAYDHAVPGYIRNNRALTGGDLNLELNAGAAPYLAYSLALGAVGGVNGGAGFGGIRANQPGPAAWPAFPPAPAAAPAAPPPSANPDNMSSVKLIHPAIGGTRLLSANIDHFKNVAIDNIFYRGFTAPQSPRHLFRQTPVGIAQQSFLGDIYDLLRAVRHVLPAAAAGGGPAGPDNFLIAPAIIAQFQHLPAWVNAGFPAVGGAVAAGTGAAEPGLSQVENARRLFQDIVLGVFQPIPLAAGGDPIAAGAAYAGPAPIPGRVTAERRAAEFIKLFVSDHLPVIFTANI